MTRASRALRLDRPRRTKRRVPTRVVQPLLAPAALNRTWAIDVMSGALHGGRRLRTPIVLDEGNREALAIEKATPLPGARVVSVPVQLAAIHGASRPSAATLTVPPRPTTGEQSSLEQSARRGSVRVEK